MSTIVNKKSFKVTIEDKEQEFAVLRPDHRQAQQGTLEYAKAYREAVAIGVPIQEEMERLLLPKIWNDQKQEEVDVRLKFLQDAEKRLAAGGNKVVIDDKELPGLTKSQARELSVQMRMKRIELQMILSDRNRLYQNTAEAFAEQAKFDYFVSVCTVYGNGERYFKNSNDYFDEADTDPVKQEAQRQMMALMYPIDVDSKKQLPENRFLLKYGFCNDKLELTKDGKRCDVEGHLVNELGQRINDKGEAIDEQGNPVTENGEPKVEFAEFLEEPVEKPAPPAEGTSEEPAGQ